MHSQKIDFAAKCKLPTYFSLMLELNANSFLMMGKSTNSRHITQLELELVSLLSHFQLLELFN
jgi:hypothetical protein